MVIPMNKQNNHIFAFALIFLFFIQMAGILIESIYILDLMNTSLDAKVLGLLFFFTPVLLVLIRKQTPAWTLWLIFGLLFIARGIVPYMNTLDRMLASGVGTGATLLLLALLMTARQRDDSHANIALTASAGLALAVALSILLRTFNYSLDYSLVPSGGWLGWGLLLLLGWTLTRLTLADTLATPHSKHEVAPALLGIFLTVAMTYFAFSAPAVIARWTQGNYFLIVTTVSLLSIGWVFLALTRPDLPDRVSRRALLIWNLFFLFTLTMTLLAQRVSFPLTQDAPAVVVETPSWIQYLPLMGMLFSFPVIFLDLRIFFNVIQQAHPSPRTLMPGMLLGSLTLVLLVFINIFTNVWGYVEPVSTIFRNQYYLPYLLIAGAITLLAWRLYSVESVSVQDLSGTPFTGWAVFLALIFLGTTWTALRTASPQPADPNKTLLIVMTYNIQEANDGFGEQSHDRQLALIQKISPDILALQETDSARISLNNNDYVRYYASQLGYYSYYGPTTVTGTFGTAILSKYPLQNTRSVFTYSDTDEIGTAEAEIEVNGHVFNIYNVHPDGSDAAKLIFANDLIERSRNKSNVIALGDFNLRDYEEAYQLMAGTYVNAWTSVYPLKIGADGTDMSGENRIDHIFISTPLKVRDAFYILPPDSATDHPVHWARIFWEKK
jgi:endonuclease/exonuclease/phosphatase family metal-dependent hydrolase